MYLKLLVFPLFFLLASGAKAQECVIANERLNIVYVGIPNPIRVAAAGRSCSSIELRADKGRVEKTGIPCTYNVHPSEPGILNFEVAAGKKVIGRMVFRARPIPPPVAVVGNKKGGTISAKELSVQTGIIAELLNFDFDVRYKINGYTVVVQRKDSVVFRQDARNAYFSEQAKKIFGTLIAGDVVLFSNISVTGPDERVQELLPLLLTIAD